jgi:hypothetical protein
MSDLLVLGDQQTSDRSFRQCPIFGEVLTCDKFEPERAINQGENKFTKASADYLEIGNSDFLKPQCSGVT